MELDPRPQPEGRALGVLGKFEALGQRRVVEQLLPEVLDQPIMQRKEEIVGRGRPVMLLRVEPTRGDVGVPGKRHAALGLDLAGTAGRRLREDRERAERCRAHRHHEPNRQSPGEHATHQPHKPPPVRPTLLREPCANSRSAMQKSLLRHQRFGRGDLHPACRAVGRGYSAARRPAIAPTVIGL